MQMKAAIAALLQSAKDRNYGVPRETEVSRAYAALTPPATDVVLSEPPDIDEITREMRRKLRSGSDLSPAELRDAPVCLWAGSHPLDSVDDAAADVYFDLLRSGGNRGMFRRLAAVYVVRYPVRFPRFKKASEILSELAGRFPRPWSNAQKSLWIFTPERGPDLIASAACTSVFRPCRLWPTTACGCRSAPVSPRPPLWGDSGKSRRARCAWLSGSKSCKLG